MDQRTEENSKLYWKSSEHLNELLSNAKPNEKTTEFDEFQTVPSTDFTKDGSKDGIDENGRREFLKLMGASIAMMGASACTRRPVEKIIPYVKRPEEIVPGIANWYASTCMECDSGCGILVKTREGRPIKFEGNPKHPTSQGGLCAKGQASVLNLYDPDRLKGSLEPGRQGTGNGISWESLDQKVVNKLRAVKSSGKKVVFLTGELTGPSTLKAIREFTSGFSGSKHVTYEVLGHEELFEAAEASYGKRIAPRYRFEKADYILTFGADFLGTWGSTVEYSKAFSKKRKLGAVNLDQSEGMSKLVVFEPMMTLTGTNSDERYRLKSGDEFKAAAALAHELIVTQGKSKFAGNGEVRAALTPYASKDIAAQLGVSAEVIKKVASEIWENRGKSIVLGGGHVAKGDHGFALELIVNLLNSALENEGSTIDGEASVTTAMSSYSDLINLISDMKSGNVEALFIYGMNPIYSLPKNLNFEEALSKVGMVVDFSMKLDETARMSDIVCALSHHTETWGDANPYEGLYSIAQPTIAPLYDTRAFEECLVSWAKGLGATGALASSGSWYDYLKANWSNSIHKEADPSLSFNAFWEKSLRDGVAANGFTKNSNASRARSFSVGSLNSVPKLAWNNATSLVLYPKVSQGDGRNANNGWLQELPDPVTKMTWDNYLSISDKMAKNMGVQEGDVLKVKMDNVSVDLPAHIQPGLHDQTVSVAVGYGRKGVGRVGDGIGVNTFPLSSKGGRALAMSALTVTLEKTGGTYPLASTQKHHSMENRPIVKEAKYVEYKKNRRAGNLDHEENISLWEKHSFPVYKWAMAIDLNSCTGCGSCVIGCQSENNIPVVGKQFVMGSREMHWLRIDRYYAGNVDSPEVVHQPMLCQHCDNAPCETVCPVLATMHDQEGLNQQVYNRCVGTRYCANNCPYKVRRFNWFTFSDVDPSLRLAYNPDLTVRTRGVMEKCTFCVQRIRTAKDTAKDLGRRVEDGEMKTACQQSCPTDAISFGNINDGSSQVYNIAKDPRGYHVLAELNTRPAVTYLTKIRNS